MTTMQLKNILIDKITGIDDKSFLLIINSIIEANADTRIYKTTSEQKKRISKSRNEVAKGNVLSHEEVQKDLNKWLNEE